MASTNDELRLIPFGTIMRKLRIDKLPQLINVLIGELSLIGPRPTISNQMEELPLWYRERFFATPGFVGLYKTFENNKFNYDEIMRVDIRYVHHQSFWLDIKVLRNRAIETFLEINSFLLSPSAYNRSKPYLDSFLAIFGLIIFSPLLFLVAIMIKVTSKGPIFYSQERVGTNGQLFEIIKFRTMHFKAEDQLGPTWAKKNDPRITHLGRILRKTHIDELPQLVNVIQGEMSIVGPRPERPFFVDKFKKDIPDYTKRLTVKPGMTGLAQCYYKYDETFRDVKKKLQYDILYIKKMCLLLDLKILLLTLRVSLFGEMTKQRLATPIHSDVSANSTRN